MSVLLQRALRSPRPGGPWSSSGLTPANSVARGLVLAVRSVHVAPGALGVRGRAHPRARAGARSARPQRSEDGRSGAGTGSGGPVRRSGSARRARRPPAGPRPPARQAETGRAPGVSAPGALTAGGVRPPPAAPPSTVLGGAGGSHATVRSPEPLGRFVLPSGPPVSPVAAYGTAPASCPGGLVVMRRYQPSP